MNHFHIRRSRLRACLAGAAVCLAVADLVSPASADVGPDDEIYSPRVEAGEFEVGVRYYDLSGNGQGAGDGANAIHETHETRPEIGYSPTGFWRASVSPVLVNGPRSATHLHQIQIENVFALPGNGDGLWPNTGLFLSYEIGTIDDSEDELVLGPVFEKRLAHWLLSANIFLDRAMVSAPDVGLSYGWQARWHPPAGPLDLGVQGFGEHEFLAEDDEDENPHAPRYAPGHRAGPALFGELAMGGDAQLDYQLGLLFGLDDDAADRTLRLAVEYAFAR
ncbi:hypothetical protein [Salinisphaera orenii]|uniref:Transporter n=1 Tax=Salinisphaera orenii YIM 95161 TaxID=1051139 RepID=A0A423QB26_9GAMM|nr:hypothetical protein [Salinisphaera halophila]ROO37786.1 hypothetical protein SAHL_00120 [Salinisphaera halophila YIM 95161]